MCQSAWGVDAGTVLKHFAGKAPRAEEFDTVRPNPPSEA
jgi:hypothetical protein